MGAPTCNVSPTPPPRAKTSPLVNNVPVAKDLASAIQAVNALRQVVNGLIGQNTGGNGGVGPGPAPLNPGFSSQSQFQVTNQTITKTRIYDPNDPSKQTYVDVDQVVALTMQNPVTRETWQWAQPGQAGG